MTALATSLIDVGARGSRLSVAQVAEVLQEIRAHHPDIDFATTTISTVGDRNRQQSLRTLDKTDFFTKEIDEALLSGAIRIAIHSAKDLPDPLPDGLSIVAITKGLDPRDALVLPPNVQPTGAMLIATSSARREEAVKKVIPDTAFIDIRGTIEERLAQLDKGLCDGVVIAECALIRLGLDHLNRILLPDETASLQGQLAIVARDDDQEMQTLFSAIDCRKSCLYFGLELPQEPHRYRYTHCPIIRTIPVAHDDPSVVKAFCSMPSYTHVIFTSRTAVRTLFALLAAYPHSFGNKTAIAVGRGTARELQRHGITNILVADDERAEGIVQRLSTLNTDETHFFWPHSRLSRPLILNYLKANNIQHTAAAIYDTVTTIPSPQPLPSSFDALFFTSPSTVDAFVTIFGTIPDGKELITIGPSTKMHLHSMLTLKKGANS